MTRFASQFHDTYACGKRGSTDGSAACNPHERRLGECSLSLPRAIPSRFQGRACTDSGTYSFLWRARDGQDNANGTYRAYLNLTTSESKPDLDSVVRVDADGWGAFTCLPGELQVWVRVEGEATCGVDASLGLAVGAGADADAEAGIDVIAKDEVRVSS